jgi:acylphosphatase
MLHKKIKVIGKVQGVFFRVSAKKKAEELNIKGIVRNEKDCSVYIEVEGDEPEIRKFIDWCKKGPLGAAVANVEIIDGPVKNFQNFQIIH